MKKLIVLLLTIAMVGAVFAQDQKAVATFGGYLDASGDFMDGLGPGLYSETYYNYSSGGVGFSATIVGAEDIFAKVRNYSLSYQVIPELKVMVGKLRETGGARLTSYVDGNGFSTRIANVQNGLMGQVSYMGVGLAVFSTLDKIQNINGGLSYTVKDVAKIVGGYLGTSKEVWVSADVLAVKGLTARVGFRNVASKSYIYATAGSSSFVEKLDLGLDADLVLATTVAFGAKAKAEYALTDKYSVGAFASYDNGDAWNGNNGLNGKVYGVMNFAQGDIVLGLQYDVKTNTFSIPFDFEVSF